MSMEIEDKEGTQKDDKIKREKGRLGRHMTRKTNRKKRKVRKTGKNDKTKNELLILSCFNFYLILDLFPLQDATPTAF